ncbi:MAG: hypothetical protein IJ802_02010, partial [Kiritimatiellae bacterium]|nr:hypothetical protein [Kiritimatiellia bacterium]
MVTISERDWKNIVEYAAGRLPEEACGLLAGDVLPEGTRIVRKVYFLENTDHSNEHFSMSPR